MDVFRPEQPCGTGVLVLAGSSGRVDVARAKLFARHGAVSMPLQWFGGLGLQPGPWEVPIETFIAALDVLSPEVDRLAIVGTSFGAEAALITGSLDRRVHAVAAFAPSSVAWSAYDTVVGRPTSKWTYGGALLPCLPVVRPESMPAKSIHGYLHIYEHSLQAADPDQLESSAIAVEEIPEVLLVTGGDDLVWPSATFAGAIQERRAKYGLETQHVHLKTAGHRAVLPTEEQPPEDARAIARGGNAAADAELGRRAWKPLCRLLNLHGSSP